MIENTNTKQFYPGPILNDTLEINEFLFNTAEQVKIKHSKLDENGVLRDVDLEYGYDYEVTKDEALTCEDDETPSHTHLAEMALTASTGQILLKEHVNVLAGERLTAYRESAIIQDKNYPRTGAFPAAAHEGALDYLTMQNQEQQDELDRALKVPISTQNFAGSMPLPVPGRALKINQDGSGFEMSEFDPDIALTTTENFRNEAQQFASEAALSASSAKSSETVASQKVNEITALHSNYMDDINTTSTDYLNQINSRGNTIIKDADAIINRVGLNMFDTVTKDHFLTYEESKGLALQGTYVYKEVVAGSRYGYPDFYNKCLEEKEQATAKEVTLAGTAITLYINSNGHQFYDIANKDVVDNFFTAIGLAWFYGIDTENERVFLPRNNWFEQLTVDVDGVGDSVEAGLPNITGSSSMLRGAEYQGAGSGAIYVTTGTGKAYSTVAVSSPIINFDASRSNAIYGKSSTVQPNAVKKLLYICVGNTQSLSTITDVVDVTTTENDTIPLFTGMYFDFKPNNVSWLKGGEQANSGGVYATCYNDLIKCLNEQDNIYNIKVINESDMVTGVDYSLYWKINQDDMSFIAPIRTEERILVEKKEPTDTDKSWYNLYSDGWVEQGGVYSSSETDTRTINLQKEMANINYNIQVSLYGNINDRTLRTEPFTTTAFYCQVKSSGSNTSNATGNISWVVCGQSAEIPSNGSLYFKVANAVTNLELLNAGEVLEAVADISANVIPNNSSLIAGYGMPSSRYIDLAVGASGTLYTAPANGWYCVTINATSANGWGALNASSGIKGHCLWSAGGNGQASTHIPVIKGQTVGLNYGNCTVIIFKFIYAEGSKGDS